MLQLHDVPLCSVVLMVYAYAMCQSRFRYKQDEMAITAIEARKRTTADPAWRTDLRRAAKECGDVTTAPTPIVGPPVRKLRRIPIDSVSLTWWARRRPQRTEGGAGWRTLSDADATRFPFSSINWMVTGRMGS